MSDTLGLARARAHANIALIKYWGKRDIKHNLPAAGSLSLTLDGLTTETRVRFGPELIQDTLTLDGRAREASDAKTKRVSEFLDLIRARAGMTLRAEVETTNHFPTGAGLASSASGFAALALAASDAAGLQLEPEALSALARQGSGSAARSTLGGFVEMLPGSRDDGEDAYAVQLAPPEHWDLRCLVATCADGEKELGSTEAMNRTAATSPYYRPWLEDVPRTLEVARQAVLTRDLDALATVTEASCLRMHACAMGASPGILYWQAATVGLIHAVRRARASGWPVFFTIDAGPHVKVFCPGDWADEVARWLGQQPGVGAVIAARPGQGATLR